MIKLEFLGTDMKHKINIQSETNIARLICNDRNEALDIGFRKKEIE